MSDFINRHSVTLNHKEFLRAVKTLSKLVVQNRHELELQSHIEKHPYILSQQLSHCHHVFPRVKLGERFVADFFCLDIPSSGKEWIGVEIKRAGIKVITKAGRKTALLEHALQQVRDWRQWTIDNIDYARRSVEKSGLGLEEIQPRFIGWVIIGRRDQYNREFNKLRQQIFRDELIQVRSWDGVIEWAEQRAKHFQGTTEALALLAGERG